MSTGETFHPRRTLQEDVYSSVTNFQTAVSSIVASMTDHLRPKPSAAMLAAEEDQQPGPASSRARPPIRVVSLGWHSLPHVPVALCPNLQPADATEKKRAADKRAEKRAKEKARAMKMGRDVSIALSQLSSVWAVKERTRLLNEHLQERGVSIPQNAIYHDSGGVNETRRQLLKYLEHLGVLDDCMALIGGSQEDKEVMHASDDRDGEDCDDIAADGDELAPYNELGVMLLDTLQESALMSISTGDILWGPPLVQMGRVPYDVRQSRTLPGSRIQH